ncbi:MAG: DUF4298 domain-containing protein [Christensenellales bacterium]|jgi:hypothetical protein
MKEQVIKFEKILNNSEETLKALNKALDAFEANQPDYLALKKYYLSEEYRKDVDISNNSNEYKDIACGVLSEDAVYNLIGESFHTYIRMLELATKFLKEH